MNSAIEITDMNGFEKPLISVPNARQNPDAEPNITMTTTTKNTPRCCADMATVSVKMLMAGKNDLQAAAAMWAE